MKNLIIGINFNISHKLIRNLCLILLLLFVHVPKSYADPLPYLVQSVVMLRTSYGGRMFNPYLIYGNQLSYYIRPSSRNLYLNIDGHEVSVDLNAILVEAMKEWKNALGIGFVETHNEYDAMLIIDNSIQPSANLNDTLASATYYGNWFGSRTDPRATLSIYSQMIQKDLDANVFSDYSKVVPFFGEISKSDFVMIYLRALAKHELGHVLGFDHTPLVGQNLPRDDILISDQYRGTERMRAPIMLGEGVPYYLIELYRSVFGRMPAGPNEAHHLTINDVQISPQEAAVSNLLLACSMLSKTFGNKGQGSTECVLPKPHFYSTYITNILLLN